LIEKWQGLTYDTEVTRTYNEGCSNSILAVVDINGSRAIDSFYPLRVEYWQRIFHEQS